MYFLSLEYQISAIQSQDESLGNDSDETLNKVIKIDSIEIGFIDKFNSYLKLKLQLSNTEIVEVKIENNKLLHPFLYWLLFSVAKKNDILLFHNDVSVAKYRMIEYFNKNSNYKLTQDLLFANENGEYSFLISNESIEIKEKEMLLTKKSFLEIILKYSECFIPFFDSNQSNNFKTKFDKIKNIKENSSQLLKNLLHL